jgi:hypothetical protein
MREYTGTTQDMGNLVFNITDPSQSVDYFPFDLTTMQPSSPYSVTEAIVDWNQTTIIREMQVNPEFAPNPDTGTIDGDISLTGPYDDSRVSGFYTEFDGDYGFIGETNDVINPDVTYDSGIYDPTSIGILVIYSSSNPRNPRSLFGDIRTPLPVQPHPNIFTITALQIATVRIYPTNLYFMFQSNVNDPPFNISIRSENNQYTRYVLSDAYVPPTKPVSISFGMPTLSTTFVEVDPRTIDFNLTLNKDADLIIYQSRYTLWYEESNHLQLTSVTHDQNSVGELIIDTSNYPIRQNLGQNVEPPANLSSLWLTTLSNLIGHQPNPVSNLDLGTIRFTKQSTYQYSNVLPMTDLTIEQQEAGTLFDWSMNVLSEDVVAFGRNGIFEVDFVWKYANRLYDNWPNIVIYIALGSNKWSDCIVASIDFWYTTDSSGNMVVDNYNNIGIDIRFGIPTIHNGVPSHQYTGFGQFSPLEDAEHATTIVTAIENDHKFKLISEYSTVSGRLSVSLIDTNTGITYVTHTSHISSYYNFGFASDPRQNEGKYKLAVWVEEWGTIYGDGPTLQSTLYADMVELSDPVLYKHNTQIGEFPFRIDLLQPLITFDVAVDWPDIPVLTYIVTGTSSQEDIDTVHLPFVLLNDVHIHHPTMESVDLVLWYNTTDTTLRFNNYVDWYEGYYPDTITIKKIFKHDGVFTMVDNEGIQLVQNVPLDEVNKFVSNGVFEAEFRQRYANSWSDDWPTVYIYLGVLHPGTAWHGVYARLHMYYRTDPDGNVMTTSENDAGVRVLFSYPSNTLLKKTDIYSSWYQFGSSETIATAIQNDHKFKFRFEYDLTLGTYGFTLTDTQTDIVYVSEPSLPIPDNSPNAEFMSLDPIPAFYVWAHELGYHYGTEQYAGFIEISNMFASTISMGSETRTPNYNVGVEGIGYTHGINITIDLTADPYRNKLNQIGFHGNINIGRLVFDIVDPSVSVTTFPFEFVATVHPVSAYSLTQTKPIVWTDTNIAPRVTYTNTGTSSQVTSNIVDIQMYLTNDSDSIPFMDQLTSMEIVLDYNTPNNLQFVNHMTGGAIGTITYDTSVSNRINVNINLFDSLGMSVLDLGIFRFNIVDPSVSVTTFPFSIVTNIESSYLVPTYTTNVVWTPTTTTSYTPILSTNAVVVDAATVDVELNLSKSAYTIIDESEIVLWYTTNYNIIINDYISGDSSTLYYASYTTNMPAAFSHGMKYTIQNLNSVPNPTSSIFLGKLRFIIQDTSVPVPEFPFQIDMLTPTIALNASFELARDWVFIKSSNAISINSEFNWFHFRNLPMSPTITLEDISRYEMYGVYECELTGPYVNLSSRAQTDNDDNTGIFSSVSFGIVSHPSNDITAYPYPHGIWTDLSIWYDFGADKKIKAELETDVQIKILNSYPTDPSTDQYGRILLRVGGSWQNVGLNTSLVNALENAHPINIRTEYNIDTRVINTVLTDRETATELVNYIQYFHLVVGELYANVAFQVFDPFPALLASLGVGTTHGTKPMMYLSNVSANTPLVVPGTYTNTATSSQVTSNAVEMQMYLTIDSDSVSYLSHLTSVEIVLDYNTTNNLQFLYHMTMGGGYFTYDTSVSNRIIVNTDLSFVNSQELDLGSFRFNIIDPSVPVPTFPFNIVTNVQPNRTGMIVETNVIWI